MKAIIVEIKGRYAAALSNDGVVSKIKNKDFCLGQEIVIRNNSNNLIKVAASAAAAIMIFVTPAWAYLTPYSYVSLDVNPSFEFSINRFDRVLTVKAINDDGEGFVKSVNVDGLKNKEIQNAVKSVLNDLKSQGYIIEGEESGVIVATSSKTQDKTDMLAKKLRTAVNEEVGDVQGTEDTEAKKSEKPDKPDKSENKEKPKKTQETEINMADTIGETEDFTDDDKPEKQEKQGKQKKSEKPEKPEKSEKQEKPEKQEKSTEHSKKQNIQVIEVTEEEVDEARKLKVTPGKMNLIGKLQEAAELTGYNEKAEDWLNNSVQDINAKIKEYKEELKQKEENKKNDKSNNKDASSNKGNGNGNNNQDSRNNGNDNKDKKKD